MEDKTRSTRVSRSDHSDRDDSYRRRDSQKKSRHRSDSLESEDERSRRHRDRRRDDDRKNRSDDGENPRRRKYDDEDDRDRRRSYHRRDRSREDLDYKDSRRERRHRDRSRSRERSHKHRRSRSPAPKRRRSRSNSPFKRSKAPLPSQDESFRGEVAPGEAPPPEKQKPNFKPTGLLAKEANIVAGTSTVLKYHEPPEARKPPPKEQWRMYIFKGKDLLDTIYIHERSAWLMGRDQKVTDLFLEHPSISKQHAVIQFRYITTKNEYGDKLSKVKPYLIDLESKKGTKLNGKPVEASRFVELVDQDVLNFADSDREYVLMLPSAEK